MWRLLAATASVWKSNIHYVCFAGARSRSCRRSQQGSGKTKGAARGVIYTTKRHFTQCDLTALHHCFSKFCQVYAAATDKRKYTIIKCVTSCCCHPSSSLCACCICADCKSKPWAGLIFTLYRAETKCQVWFGVERCQSIRKNNQNTKHYGMFKDKTRLRSEIFILV